MIKNSCTNTNGTVCIILFLFQKIYYKVVCGIVGLVLHMYKKQIKAFGYKVKV